MPETKVHPGVIIVGGLGLGLAAVVVVFALAQAAPPTPPEGIYCPYCGAGPFATIDEANEHIAEAHPGMPFLIHIEWQ